MTRRAPVAAPVSGVAPMPWPGDAKCSGCRHCSAIHPLGGWCELCRCERFAVPFRYWIREALRRFRAACSPFPEQP